MYVLITTGDLLGYLTITTQLAVIICNEHTLPWFIRVPCKHQLINVHSINNQISDYLVLVAMSQTY